MAQYDYLNALDFYNEGKNNVFTATYDDNGVLTNLDWDENNPKAKPTMEQLDSIIANDLPAQAQAKIDLKASAKAKLVAGEPLTEAEADTLVI